MRRFRIIIVFLAVAVTALRGYLFMTKSQIDVAPVITCDTELIEVSSKATDEEILKHATAYDEQDGDITKDMYVERMYYMTGYKKSRISFVSTDSDNNITKKKVDILYTDYESPRIDIESNLIFPANSKISLKKYFKATDIFDGDVTNRIRLISDTYDSTRPGTYEMVARASNSHGDITEIKFHVYIVAENFKPTIKLNKYVTYTAVGKSIDYASIISAQTPNISAIEIDDSNVDINTSGSYEVFYRLKNGNKTKEFTRLIVVVGDWQ